ncbi:MAG: isoleucine--tRNA ligase [Bacilli bacterium]|nr:isoleucine--tRNA ligase [Bacilli bacterium]
MKNFKELDKRPVNEVESTILNYWKENKIFEKTISSRKGKEDFVFYDGPIYANAKPGIHHVLAKSIKDSFTKYKTMQGYRVLRKIGLDTHGLPIEVNVEKKLGFSGKQDIEKFGVENFCKECNKNTALNIDEVNKLTDMMGQFIDCENPYVTCSNEFIESEWWIIKEMFKKDLIYHGNKILWYCPRCGTELSSFEVAQGYQEDPVNSIILPFKKADEDAYFLVWTTTPWTLIANVALCVNPDLTYLKVKSQGYTFYVGERLANSVLGDEFEVLETFKGTDLKGMKYEQLLPFVNVEGKAFEVLADNYVTDSDGTGIVHIAPAYGADDNRVANAAGITFVNPVGPDGCYTEGPWKGRLVTDKDLEVEIIKYLKENDKLFKKIHLTHDYPHCWRCKSALISYPKPAWYVATTKKKDEIIEANKKINWYPDYVGEKRFANWLENMVDWGISRSRYWGCPLPIWTNKETGEIYCVGSREELQKLAIEDVDIMSMELHRPYIDNVHIKSPETGDTLTRVEDVLDVWFDSGSMPYAQFHYPFENKEIFESQFPADFIAEGLDQTRGWFYVLLVISTLISGESCFKNVVVNDMVLDGKGKKMSKSIGNIVDPIETITKYGADNVRWYMFYVSPVWTPLKFDMDGLKEVHSKFFNPFKNTYSFFQTYANIDGIDINECNVPVKDREEIDKWLISKYNKLVKNVTAFYDQYDLNLVVKEITSFVSDDLSNWYIRRNRDRFWASELDNSKKSVYMTTYEILTGVCKLAAPIIPYTTEEIYQNLTGEESVHLSNFPTFDESLINEEIEVKMDLVRDLISTGRFVREETKIKVRQPLSEALIDGKYEKTLGDLVELIKEELNVKKVTFVSDLSKYMNFNIKPNFKVCGAMFGPRMKDYQALLQNLAEEDEEALLQEETITVDFDGERLDVTPDMVDVRIEAKEGFNVGMQNNKFVILNTELTEELILEGLAREFVSKVQNIRKTIGLEISDRIDLTYSGDELTNKAFEDFKEYIMSETLAVNYSEKDSGEVNDINGHEVKIEVKKN